MPLPAYAELARPTLRQKPSCKVKLICGPPASGKSTYVKAHAGPQDIVIDSDLIAREQGWGRERPSQAVGEILDERNRRLMALADAPADRQVWVIIGGASPSLRQWWREALAVAPSDLITTPIGWASRPCICASSISGSIASVPATPASSRAIAMRTVSRPTRCIRGIANRKDER
jgi:hypothetical protein